MMVVFVATNNSNDQLLVNKPPTNQQTRSCQANIASHSDLNELCLRFIANSNNNNNNNDNNNNDNNNNNTTDNKNSHNNIDIGNNNHENNNNDSDDNTKQRQQ